MDRKLLDVLVCPLCKGELEYKQVEQELICHKCKLAYTIDDGIPVMIIDQARKIED